MTIRNILLLLIAALFGACRDKDAFIIKGELQNPAQLKKVYLLAADSAGIQLIDSTNLSETGAFQFKGMTTYPNLFKLRIGGFIFDLIAQNGDVISFRTDLKDTGHASSISGSQATLELEQWDKINDQYAAKNQQLLERYQAELQRSLTKEDSLLKVYSTPYQQIAGELSKKTLAFALDHKTSLAGFYAATSLDHKKYEPWLIAYAEAIRPYFEGNPAVRSFVKEMETAKPVSVGQKAPEFSAANLGGKQVKLSDFRGKYVMIDFWASWCPPCRQENPNIVRLYNRYHPKGLQLLGISLDTEARDWQKAIDSDHLDWTQVSDQARFDGAAEKLYHIQEIPSNFIIDPRGIIIAKNLYGTELAAFLDRTFADGRLPKS